ncbi:MAG: TonB-dependent receptor [Thermoanaerobaculia bacterium]
MTTGSERMRMRLLLAVCAVTSLVAVATPAAAQTAPSGAVTGSVVDVEGQGLAAVTVEVLEPGEQVLTDENGEFTLELPAGTYTLLARAPSYTVETMAGVEVGEGEATEVTFTLELAMIPLDEIVVSARYSILRDQPISVTTMTRKQIVELPHFGDDLYRAVKILPGTSGGDITSRFSVRGSLDREVLAELDGVELFEPYHLKDFEGIFSVLDPQLIGGLDLFAAGFPAEFGDRSSSVLDMTTIRPTSIRTNLGISFSNVWAGSSGAFAGNRGHWLASVRRGYLDLILKIANDGDDEDGTAPKPRYWDATGKLGYDLTKSQSLRVEMLLAGDTLLFDEVDGDETLDAETRYGSKNAWIGHQALLSEKTFVDSILSFQRIDRDRSVDWVDPTPEERLVLVDDRVLDILGLRQDWNHQLSGNHYLKWGFELRGYDTTYDYLNDQLIRDRIDDPRFPPGELTRFYQDELSGEHYALYAADRMRLFKGLTAEIGLRYDKQTMLEDDQFSPRVNLVYDIGGGGVLRFGWGHFYQSHRPHELEVEFGETEFYPAEQAEHWTLGFEKELGKTAVRAEFYRRQIDTPRPYYVTLFDPWKPLPEFASDLVRITPDTSLAQGAELFIGRRHGGKIDWWASYTWATIEDDIDGGTQPRYYDQTHAVTASISYRPSRKWNLSWVGFYHTGWPTTEIFGLATPSEDGNEIQHFLGDFYAERLDDYQRLDMRVSRITQVGRKGQLTFFLDVQNLLNRENERGKDIDEDQWTQLPDGNWAITYETTYWLQIMPSFGVMWEF